ncbi:MAG: hypothetical protein EAY65_04940 [Alphaproteobacteria bacterium]|nr:MAG: hypothetical protein EAY65_04940 [Alphaproteobacteria bacterium]
MDTVKKNHHVTFSDVAYVACATAIGTIATLAMVHSGRNLGSTVADMFSASEKVHHVANALGGIIAGSLGFSASMYAMRYPHEKFAQKLEEERNNVTINAPNIQR